MSHLASVHVETIQHFTVSWSCYSPEPRLRIWTVKSSSVTIRCFIFFLFWPVIDLFSHRCYFFPPQQAFLYVTVGKTHFLPVTSLEHWLCWRFSAACTTPRSENLTKKNKNLASSCYFWDVQHHHLYTVFHFGTKLHFIFFCFSPYNYFVLSLHAGNPVWLPPREKMKWNQILRNELKVQKVKTGSGLKWKKLFSPSVLKNYGVSNAVVPTWGPLVSSHQKREVIPVVTLWVGYVLWYIIVWGENERGRDGARLPPCCFKWSKMDPLEVAQQLAKEGTLWAIKAIKEVLLQSNPCGQVLAERQRKFIFLIMNLTGFSGAVAADCSSSGHLTVLE